MKKQSQQLSHRSFRAVATEEVENWIKRKQLKSPHPYRFATGRLLEALGPDANREPKDLSPVVFARVRNALAENCELASATFAMLSRTIRLILELMVPHGLNPACVAAFRSNCSVRASESGCIPLRESHLKLILSSLAGKAETVQILVWIGLSGGLALLDAVLLRFSSIDWATGLLRGRRAKTGVIFQFVALPPLLELLKRRKEHLGPGAIFALPELIFTKTELLDAECNTVSWESIPPRVTLRAAAQASKAINELLHGLGIDANQINWRALRRRIISIWASHGVRLHTCMRMVGQSSKEAHLLWKAPTEDELLRVGELTWKYLMALRNDLPHPLNQS